MSSATLAPLAAAQVSPLCLRSCRWRSGRPAICLALSQARLKFRGDNADPDAVGNSQASGSEPTKCSRCELTAGTMFAGIELREGRAGEAAAAYSHHGRVHRSTNPSELIGDMVERWWAARESGDDAVLYAYARDAVRVLNGLARRHVEVAGRLSGPELDVEEFAPADLAPRTYRVGDELCCLRNRTRLGAGRDPSGKGVRNGTRGVIQAIDCQSREVTLATSDGRSVRLPAEYVKRSTDYGYAWTLHKGQGQTVGQAQRSDADEVARRRGRAFVFGAEGLSAEAALVAASRATDSTELFVLSEPDETASTGDGDEELGRAWSRSEQQRLALDELETGAEIARLAGDFPGGARPRARHARFVDRRRSRRGPDDTPGRRHP